MLLLLLLLLPYEVVVVLLVIPRPLVPLPLPPLGCSPRLPLILLTPRLLLEHQLRDISVLVSQRHKVLGILLTWVTHPHGCVHKKDEDSHSVNRHKVSHHPPALLLAWRLALARVQTRHWSHTRHWALGVDNKYVSAILFCQYLTSEAALMGGVARPGPTCGGGGVSPFWPVPGCTPG